MIGIEQSGLDQFNYLKDVFMSTQELFFFFKSDAFIIDYAQVMVFFFVYQWRPKLLPCTRYSQTEKYYWHTLAFWIFPFIFIKGMSQHVLVNSQYNIESFMFGYQIEESTNFILSMDVFGYILFMKRNIT